MTRASAVSGSRGGRGALVGAVVALRLGAHQPRGLAPALTRGHRLFEQRQDLGVHRAPITPGEVLHPVTDCLRDTDIHVHDLLSHTASLPNRLHGVANLKTVMLQYSHSIADMRPRGNKRIPLRIAAGPQGRSTRHGKRS